jgi:hypothetical protein
MAMTLAVEPQWRRGSTLAFLSRLLNETEADPDSFATAKIGSANTRRFSAKCLRQIDVLSRTKHSALTGLEIGRDDPQPEGHIEGIDAQRGPKAELADPMLFRVAGSAQRNGVAIAWLYSDTTIGSGADMRRL